MEYIILLLCLLVVYKILKDKDIKKNPPPTKDCGYFYNGSWLTVKRCYPFCIFILYHFIVIVNSLCLNIFYKDRNRGETFVSPLNKSLK